MAGSNRHEEGSRSCDPAPGFRSAYPHGPLRKLMDEMIRWAKRHRMLSNTLTIDSTQLDVRYRSRHYEQRCRHHAKPRRRSADSKRSATAKTTPKLIVGTDIRSHLALSLTPRTGMGSDAPEFLP